MDSINEVMEAVKAYCKEKTSDATYAILHQGHQGCQL